MSKGLSSLENKEALKMDDIACKQALWGTLAAGCSFPWFACLRG